MGCVEPADVALLTSPAGRALLAALPRYAAAEALALGERLRASGHPPALVAAALTQARLRTRAAERWGTAAEPLLRHLLLTPEGAEQATRPSVAALRAARFASLGAEAHVADLGCGVGLDAARPGRRGPCRGRLRGRRHDRRSGHGQRREQPRRCAHPGARTPMCSAFRASTGRRTAPLFADPARRAAGRRLSRPEDWSPPLSWVLALPVADLGLKVAPGLDHAAVDAETEFAVVSDGGDVVEAGLYRGALRDPGVHRSATLLPSGARAHRHRPSGPATARGCSGCVPATSRTAPSSAPAWWPRWSTR